MAAYTPGSTYVLDYAITGTATGSVRSSGTVAGGKSFNGQSGLIEHVQNQTTTYTAPATLAAAGTTQNESRFYFSENGSVVTEFGGTTATNLTVSGFAISTDTTVTYNPAKVNRRFTLAAGASDTSTTMVTTTTKTTLAAVPPTTFTETTTVTYVGQESVTVPAGTFTACKFSIKDKDGVENFEWYGKGNGAALKLTGKASDGTTVTLSLTGASRFNGQPL